MLRGFSFRARAGKAAELEALLSDPEGGRRVAQALGASRNILFWQGERMVRVLEFPAGAQPKSLAQVAASDEGVAAVLAQIGRLSEPPFDPADAASMAAFDQAAGLRLVYDVDA